MEINFHQQKVFELEVVMVRVLLIMKNCGVRTALSRLMYGLILDVIKYSAISGPQTQVDHKQVSVLQGVPKMS